MLRDSKTHREYHGKKAKKVQKIQNIECQFCDNISDENIVKSTEKFNIVKPIAPYAYWDVQGVEEHLMIVPKDHVQNFKQFNDADNLKLMKIIAEYDDKGYSVYNRGSTNIYKSVRNHLHIHIISLDQKIIKRMIYTSKPYIVRAKQ